MKKLLTILAHPDDESFGMGGTLARYASEGVAVHIAIATDGAAGSIVDGWEGDRTRLSEARIEELEKAVAILGGELHLLGYRDSGYIDDQENNHHPEAFIQAPKEEAVGRVVRLIRELKPDVIMTHDETGGYYHPDHIYCWEITTAAFDAAADPNQYSELGLPVHQAKALYYGIIPKKWIRFLLMMMRLQGKDPKRMGRNEDIDMTQLGMDEDQIHVTINYRDVWEKKKEASAAHASQGGGTSFTRFIPEWAQKRWLSQEHFNQARPLPKAGLKKKDFFDL